MFGSWEFFFLQVSRKRPFVPCLLLSRPTTDKNGAVDVCLIITPLKGTQSIQNDTRVSQNFIFQLKVNMFVILCFFSMIILKRN